MNNDYEVYQEVAGQVLDILYKSEEVETDQRDHRVFRKFGDHGTRGSDVINIRLDYEVPADEPYTVIWAYLAIQLCYDLTDLFYNGDIESTDPLLKQADGFKKKPNRAPVLVKPGWHVYEELKPAKGVKEFTFYMLVSK